MPEIAKAFDRSKEAIQWCARQLWRDGTMLNEDFRMWKGRLILKDGLRWTKEKSEGALELRRRPVNGVDMVRKIASDCNAEPHHVREYLKTKQTWLPEEDAFILTTAADKNIPDIWYRLAESLGRPVKAIAERAEHLRALKANTDLPSESNPDKTDLQDSDPPGEESPEEECPDERSSVERSSGVRPTEDQPPVEAPCEAELPDDQLHNMEFSWDPTGSVVEHNIPGILTDKTFCPTCLSWGGAACVCEPRSEMAPHAMEFSTGPAGSVAEHNILGPFTDKTFCPTCLSWGAAACACEPFCAMAPHTMEDKELI